MKNFRRKKLIIMISVLALFALVLVGCTNGEVEEPAEEPMQEEPVEEPAPSTSEEPTSDDITNTQY